MKSISNYCQNNLALLVPIKSDETKATSPNLSINPQPRHLVFKFNFNLHGSLNPSLGLEQILRPENS